LRINPQATVVTCNYCQQSSFIHIPNRADPPVPSGTQNYGHIHVSTAKAKNAAVVAIALVALLLIMVLGGVMTAVMFVRPRPAPPPPSHRDGQSNAPSEACNKAVACCKAMLGSAGQSQNLRTCEALRALSDADCQKQHRTFRDSAKQLGQTCD
jgi:hypothetical protein